MVFFKLTALNYRAFLAGFFVTLATMCAVDVAAQHVLLEPCDRAQFFQPHSCD